MRLIAPSSPTEKVKEGSVIRSTVDQKSKAQPRQGFDVSTDGYILVEIAVAVAVRAIYMIPYLRMMR